MPNNDASQTANGADVLSLFRQRLAETAAWCAPRASLSDPAGRLRTARLKPSNYEPWEVRGVLEPYSGWYTWGTPDEAHVTVTDLAQRRADLLRAENAYPADVNAPQDGKLVVLRPQESGHYGLTADVTGYYMDDGDMFPWDTWVWCDSSVDPNYNAYIANGYIALTLFCWVPALFLPAVEEAMLVDPHDCFFWADDYERFNNPTPFLRLWADAGALLTPPDAV